VKDYRTALVGLAFLLTLGLRSTDGQQGTQRVSNEQLERGKYIADIGGCNDCHTTGFAEAGGKAADSVRLKGDRLGFRGPWGTTYATNLRLSLARRTEDAWVKYAKGLTTRPPMPWFNVRAMTDADLRAFYVYVRSLPGDNGTAAPPFLPPDTAPEPPYVQWPGVK
jgi:hypothetical protein